MARLPGRKRDPPLRTRAEKAAAKRLGDLRGHWQLLARGRPRKYAVVPPPVAEEVMVCAPAKKKAKRGPYKNWRTDDNFKIVQAALKTADGYDNLGGQTLS